MVKVCVEWVCVGRGETECEGVCVCVWTGEWVDVRCV